ncbi:MAG: hypothetical protein HY901_02975 [Deltaproteobacteria bacterium]|nr:hypothetical protein [Deltaproteobacteria bacterium]
MRTLLPRVATAVCSATLVALVAAAGCSVHFSDDVTYLCSSDSDCGPEADGFKCFPVKSTDRSFCCKPSAEICDGRDNDCNQEVDDLAPVPCYSGPEGTAGKGICRAGTQVCEGGKLGLCLGETVPAIESCNGLDDDCDNDTDEGFDLQNDSKHCGSCINVCRADEWCVTGRCSRDQENCTDGIDNDRDGHTDCADSECLEERCQADPSSYTCDVLGQCSCEGSVSPGPEPSCDDHDDDDCDGLIDCADPDCDSKGCGGGCQCKAGAPSETACANDTDNDGDGLKDCEDPDCEGKLCDNGCICSAGTPKETDCADRGVDNDNDHLRDCVDPDCAGKPCIILTDTASIEGTCQGSVCQ